jgi:hypothetical protein
MIRAGVTEDERAAIEDQLRAKLAACDAAADRVDARGMAQHHSDRCGLGVIHTGTFFPTAAAVLEWAVPAFEALQDQRHDVQGLRIAVLAPDVAVMIWHGMVSVTNTDDTGWSLPFGRTFVCLKTGGEWEFVHVHVSYVPQQ